MRRRRVRANHGNSIVNAIENWYYTRHKPAAGPPDPASLPAAGAATTPARDAPPTNLPRLPGVQALPGEATWNPGRLGADGRPLIYTGYLRPDANHLSIVAGAAWM